MNGSGALIADAASLAAARNWRRVAPPFVIILAWILFLYRDTWLAMAGIWARSGTFTHGFVVPLIVVWLLWRKRDQLAALSPQPNLRAALPLLPVGLLWLAGELAAVNAVSQLAFTGLITLTVPALLGLRVAGAAAFPLGFLFFAVPIGEFAMPQLMEWTADFVVVGLHLSGVPVYREGLQFVIPSGSWSVVEACSGVRYLIASATVGTLYAYLTYRSTRRRLLFVGVSLVVPVFANWLRAYMIVMLGHLSGNRLAVGIDHLIYGWLFFGLVVGIMFWIGARWREDQPQPDLPSSRVTSAASPSPGPMVPVALAVAVIVAIWPAIHAFVERADDASAVRLASLAPVAGWADADDAIGAWRPHFEQPSAEAVSVFRRGNQIVGVYRGYYRNQDFNRKMVSSTNVVVESQDRVWARVAEDRREIRLAGAPVTLRVQELRGVDGERLVTWMCFWVDGRLTASDPWAKAYTALSRLLGRGDDSAVVILFAPKEQAGGGDAALAAYVESGGAALIDSLVQTREAR